MFASDRKSNPDTLIKNCGEILQTTDLIKSLQDKDEELTKHLLDVIKNQEVLDAYEMIKTPGGDEYRKNPLILATDNYDLRTIEKLLEMGANPSFAPQKYFAHLKKPIIYACKKLENLSEDKQEQKSELKKIITSMYGKYEHIFNPNDSNHRVYRGLYGDCFYDMRGDQLAEEKSYIEQFLVEDNPQLLNTIKDNLVTKLKKLWFTGHGDRIESLILAIQKTHNVLTIQNIIENQLSLGDKHSRAYLHSSILDPRWARSFEMLNEKLLKPLRDAKNLILKSLNVSAGADANVGAGPGPNDSRAPETKADTGAGAAGQSPAANVVAVAAPHQSEGAGASVGTEVNKTKSAAAKVIKFFKNERTRELINQHTPQKKFTPSDNDDL